MLAVRDADVAARSIGLNPVIVKTAAFTLSAALTGLAGAIFTPLMMFVSPDSFPFSQSILFLLAVIVGGEGWVLGPVVGAGVSVVLPELLSGLAEYRLLFFGALLLVVLWLAPSGIMGMLASLWARLLPRRRAALVAGGDVDVAAFLAPQGEPRPLVVDRIGITFGGITAASGVSFTAMPGKVTSVIGPNGAGKTTVLNMIGGFYAPGDGQHRAGGSDDVAAGSPARRCAPARTDRTGGRAGLEGCARRHRAHLSDHQAVRHHERARQRSDRAAPWPARRHAGVVRGRRGARDRGCAARLRGLSRRRRRAGRRSRACRPPAGRDRPRAGDAAARAAARRAGCRTDARRQGRAEQPVAPDRRHRHRGDPGRARHAARHGHFRPYRRCSTPAAIAAGTPQEAWCTATTRKGGCSRPILATAKSAARPRRARRGCSARETPCSPHCKLTAGYGGDAGAWRTRVIVRCASTAR